MNAPTGVVSQFTSEGWHTLLLISGNERLVASAECMGLVENVGC